MTLASYTRHQKAVRFFWCLLIGASLISLLGNVAHAVLSFIPRVGIQIGAAAVPPIALLAAVHGIALAVRAGASGRVYRWAVSAVAVIGAGAFAVSFLALRDLMHVIGYGATTACIFPAIVDTAVAISTLMLVALGDKPARRTRTVATAANTGTATAEPLSRRAPQRARAEVTPVASTAEAQAAQAERVQTSALVERNPAQIVQGSEHIEVTRVDAGLAPADANLASDLIASGVTTQAVETVTGVLAAIRDGASINAAAKASGINYRAAQRIVEAAAERRQGQFVAAS